MRIRSGSRLVSAGGERQLQQDENTTKILNTYILRLLTFQLMNITQNEEHGAFVIGSSQTLSLVIIGSISTIVHLKDNETYERILILSASHVGAISVSEPAYRTQVRLQIPR